MRFVRWLLARLVLTYVATSSSPWRIVSSNFVTRTPIFRISDSGRSVLDCVDADFRGQTLNLKEIYFWPHWRSLKENMGHEKRRDLLQNRVKIYLCPLRSTCVCVDRKWMKENMGHTSSALFSWRFFPQLCRNLFVPCFVDFSSKNFFNIKHLKVKTTKEGIRHESHDSRWQINCFSSFLTTNCYSSAT